MRELQELLKRFLAREIGLEQLRNGFAELLKKDADLAAPAAAWLDAGEEDGMLSAAVCTSLKSVIVSHLATISEGPDPRKTGVLGPGIDIFDEQSEPHTKTVDESAEPFIEILDEKSEPQNGNAGGAAEPFIEILDEQSEPQHPKTQLIGTEGTQMGTVLATHIEQASRTEIADRRVGKVDTVLSIGSVISNRYELLTEVGSGGMGAVYKARDLLREAAQDRKPFVALKVLSDKFREHPDSMIALQREARRAQTLAHPNVITVHEFFKDGPHYYMTMELLDGTPLDKLVKTTYFGGVSLEEAWPIIEDAGRALQYGHEQGIVHSDIKPGNLFLCSNSVVKVLDFGISRPMPLSDDTETEETVFDARERLGSLTPSYAALEMWYGDTPDPRDDIYALACVAYLLLSGRHPFSGANAKKAFADQMKPKRIPGLTSRQWSALAGGLRLRRGNRIKTVADFLERLSPVHAERNKRRMIAMGVAVAAVGAIGFGLNEYRLMLEDELINQEEIETPEPREVPPEQQEEIDALLTLARYELSGIDENAAAIEIASRLSDEVNSVLNLVESALDINPADPKARGMKEEVFDIFTRKAGDYYDRADYESAYIMVMRAGEIFNRRAIRNLRDDICERAPDVCEN